MINKDSLTILILLFQTLVNDYGYNKDELLNIEQVEKFMETINMMEKHFDKENEKELLLKLFKKYLKKLK